MRASLAWAAALGLATAAPAFAVGELAAEDERLEALQEDHQAACSAEDLAPAAQAVCAETRTDLLRLRGKVSYAETSLLIGDFEGNAPPSAGELEALRAEVAAYGERQIAALVDLPRVEVEAEEEEEEAGETPEGDLEDGAEAGEAEE